MKHLNKKTNWIFLLLILGISPVFSQNALIMLKFEDAEKAYNNGNYTEAMELLNDVEKAAGVTSKTLYLRIVVENKQFGNGAGLYEDIEKFNQLQKLRQYATKYLNALANQEIDDKYREVYRISGNLKDFPSNIQEWEQAKNEHLIKQQQVQKKEAAEQKADEYKKFSNGLLSVNGLQYHQVAQISNDSDNNTAVVYFYRPKIKYAEKTGHSIQLNDATVVGKIEIKEYVKLYFTPGLLKVDGKSTEVKNNQSLGLMTAAAIILTNSNSNSNQALGSNEKPLILNLEAGKTYYVNSMVLSSRAVRYFEENKNTGEKAIEKMKEIKL